jgi:polyvinyl alcohol dehydrogenase (cytochrome)
MTTGNNTMVSQSEIDCRSSQQVASSCGHPANLFDSVVALDLDSGAIKWAHRGLDYDTYNIACGLVTPAFSIPLPTPPFPPGLTPGYPDNCAYPLTSSLTGPDWDFAQGAMLLGDDLVGAGQKSGVYWAFNRKSGALVWKNQIVPGGITGGLQWGSAFDGSSIFVANANSGSGKQGGPGPGVGGWAAMDRKTGAVLWTTVDPMGSRAEGAVSATNDVVFGCNLAGTMFAMHAKTGAVLWSYDSGGTCNAAASISDDMVFWGSGNFGGFGTPKKIFAFGL